ncbi:MAG: NAD-dependent epimerase/dehydratase family protein [bacterium]|nr:NAD-dependent epimerase/dehydratase family protein [bacterium]
MLNGPLESTNEPLAITKIAAIKLYYDSNKQYGSIFISLMLNNLYRNGCNFNLYFYRVNQNMIA